MHKITICLLIAAIITLSGLSSCKKDYTCVCKTTGGAVFNSDIKTTKKKAQAFCDDQQTAGRTCTLQ
jgi:hypothetical protein